VVVLSRNGIVKYGIGISILVFIIISTWVYLFFEQCNGFLSGFAAASCAALFSLLLVFVGWQQLGKIHTTSNADLLHKLKGDFFREETRILIHLIYNDFIEFFVEDTGPDEIAVCYFKVDVDAINKSKLPAEIKEYLTKKMSYTTYEMDDYVLGHFEDIGLFWEKGVLDIDLIYEEFADYIETVYESKMFKEYLTYINEPEENEQLENDYYDKFECIYHQCKLYGKRKSKKRIKGSRRICY
jgi:hypothetical protein